MSNGRPIDSRDALRMALELYQSHGLDTTPLYLSAAKGDLGSPALDIKISQMRSYGFSDRSIADAVHRHISPPSPGCG